MIYNRFAGNVNQEDIRNARGENFSFPRNPMCQGVAKVSETYFPKAFTVIIPQMFVV